MAGGPCILSPAAFLNRRIAVSNGPILSPRAGLGCDARAFSARSTASRSAQFFVAGLSARLCHFLGPTSPMQRFARERMFRTYGHARSGRKGVRNALLHHTSVQNRRERHSRLNTYSLSVIVRTALFR